MAHVVFVIRMLMGATLILFGLNDMTEIFQIEYGRQADKFMSAVAKTGYLQEVRGAFLVLCGLLFVVARWVPLALILFAPIMVNILVFHAFLAPSQITVAAVLAVAQVFLAFCYWPYFRSLLVMNTPSRYGVVRQKSAAPRRPAAPAAAPAGLSGGGAPPQQRPPAAQRPPSSQRPTP